MYEWIDEIKELIQTLKGRNNDIPTRQEFARKALEILREHNVEAIVDCSSRVNTKEIVMNGSFMMTVMTDYVFYRFNYRKQELSA